MNKGIIDSLPKSLINDVALFLKSGSIKEAKTQVEQKQPIVVTESTEDESDGPAILVFDEDFNIGTILDLTESNVEVMFDEGIVKFNNENVVFEDVEDLTELSKDTLRGYMKKAKEDPAFSKKKGKPSKVTLAVRAKRSKGVEKAKEKLQAILKAESDQREKVNLRRANKAHDMFHEQAPSILKKHGFSKIASSDDRDTYVKGHDNGHATTITLSKKRPSNGFDYGSEYKAGGSASMHGGQYTHHGIGWSDEHIEATTREMMPKFENYVIDAANSHAKHHY